MKNSFVMYTDYREHVKILSREQRGDLFMALMNYASGEEVSEMDGMTEMAFSFIKAQMDRDNEKYQKTLESRREAGKKGGRPTVANGFSEKQTKAKKANGFSEKQTKAKKANGFSEKQTKAKKPDNDTDNDTDTDIKKTLCKADANALFERLWELYPQKRGKGQVSEASKRRLFDIGFEEMTRAIDRYKADLDKDAWKHPKNGSTFFNSGYVDYLDENYAPLAEMRAEQKTATQNKFNNFNQRNYDYDRLEQELLSSNPANN